MLFFGLGRGASTTAVELMNCRDEVRAANQTTDTERTCAPAPHIPLQFWVVGHTLTSEFRRASTLNPQQMIGVRLLQWSAFQGSSSKKEEGKSGVEKKRYLELSQTIPQRCVNQPGN